MCKWNVTHLNIEPPKKSKYGVSSKGFPLDQFSEYLAQGYFDLMQSIMDGFLCKKWTPWYLPVLPARTCAGRNWRTLAEAVWGPCRYCWFHQNPSILPLCLLMFTNLLVIHPPKLLLCMFMYGCTFVRYSFPISICLGYILPITLAYASCGPMSFGQNPYVIIATNQ